MDFITQISKLYGVLTGQNDTNAPAQIDPFAEIPRERQRLALTDPFPNAIPLDLPPELRTDPIPLDLHLVSAGLTLPASFHSMPPEPHFPEALASQVEGKPDAGTVMSAAVFNAAFLPILPTAQVYKPTTDKPQTKTPEDEQEALEYLANLGLNNGLLDRLRTVVQFGKNKVNFVVWLSTVTKVVVQILRTLRRETPAASIEYEDQLDLNASEDAQNSKRKRRRILKI